MKMFITLPWVVYRRDPHWVPPLLSEQRALFDRQRNPFFQHSRAEYFLARRGDQIVGRVAALVNDRHNDFHQEKVGFFGAFEVLEDPEAASALLQRACEWARAEGMAVIRGPATFSSNEEWGLLVAGFDSPPAILTTYNSPHYVQYVEQAGFRKAMDMYAYHVPKEKAQSQALQRRLDRLTQQLKQRYGIMVRRANMRNYAQETEHIRRIYNATWARNWGFVPMTEPEFTHMAGKMRRIIDPDLVLLAEVDGETVGFSLTLPDLNQALRLAYPGPHTPELVTLVKLLWYWKVHPKIRAVRLLALGLQEHARDTGLAALLYQETMRAAVAKGYQRGEVSWLLETNTMVNRGARAVGAEISKTWRIYERDLPSQ